MRYAFAALILTSISTPCLASDKQMFDWMAALKVSNAECPGQTYDVERVDLIRRILAGKLGWSDDKGEAEWQRAEAENRNRLAEDQELFCALGPAYLISLAADVKRDLALTAP